MMTLNNATSSRQHYLYRIRLSIAVGLGLLCGALSAGGPPELAMHWSMEPWIDEDTGVLPSAIGGVSGTLVNFPQDGSEWRPGVFGRALDFNGIDQHATHNAALPKTRGSLGHWLRPAAADGARIAVYESDFSGAPSPDYNGFGAAGEALEIHTAIFEGEFYAIWQDGLERREVRGGTVVADQWVHVALTWRIPGELRLYVDCELVDSAPMPSVFDNRTPTEFFVGKPSQFGQRNWAGAMDEVKVWNQEFTAQGVRSRFCPTTEPEASVLRASTPTESERFGDAIALDGNWLMVRSPGASRVDWFQQQGDSSFVFDSSKSSLYEPPDLSIPTQAQPIAIDGPLAAVTNNGVVDVYELDAVTPGIWSLVTSLSEPGIENFGTSLALSDDRIAVGSPNSSGGSVYVYEQNQGGPDAWGATFAVDGDFSDVNLGAIVDLDGDLLAIYGQSGSILGVDDDSVRLLRRGEVAGIPGWAPEGGYITEPNLINDLSVQGDRAAIGVVESSDSEQGAVLILNRNQGGPEAWEAEHVLIASDGDSLDRLGQQLAWLSDTTLAASAMGSFNRSDHQAVYLYRMGGSLLKIQDTVFLPTTFDPLTEIRFGVGGSLAATNGLILKGNPISGASFVSPPLFPGFSGRVHAFVPSEIFSDGFESDLFARD